MNSSIVLKMIFFISALPYWFEIPPYNLVKKSLFFLFTSLGDGCQLLKVVHCIVSVAICYCWQACFS